MRDCDTVFRDEVRRESYMRALTDDFSVVDLVQNESQHASSPKNEAFAIAIGMSAANTTGAMMMQADLKEIMIRCCNKHHLNVKPKVIGNPGKLVMDSLKDIRVFRNGKVWITMKVMNGDEAKKKKSLLNAVKADFVREVKRKEYFHGVVHDVKLGGIKDGDEGTFYICVDDK